jgi:transcriptional regulator with XRE-family HTH domain
MTPTQLKDWRKALSLSQARAALELGCGRRSLQKWEDGTNAIPKYIWLACYSVGYNLRAKKLKGDSK